MKKTYAGEHAERYLSLPVVSYTPDKITKRGIARTFQKHPTVQIHDCL